MTYIFLDHTADVKFLAEADSLENVLVESAKALRETICGNITILEQETKNIIIQGNNLENLLYKFLEEFLVLLDSENFLFSNISQIKVDKEKFTIDALITGDKTDNYKFTNDVKAITYNEMFIQFNEEKKLWQAQVVLDV
jgi:SHS2 domain-containing protein